MPITPPQHISQLSQRQTANNFVALQSCNITSISSGASSITFTNLPKGSPVTLKAFNTGSSGKHAYICGSNSGASGGIVAAVASSTNPQPTSGTNAVSTCDCIPAGAILTQDYISGTDSWSVICASGISTNLELSIGFGQ